MKNNLLASSSPGYRDARNKVRVLIAALLLVALVPSASGAAVPAVPAVQQSLENGEARRAMQQFGRCVARAKPRVIADVLSRPPEDPAYHRILKRLSQDRSTCVPRLSARGLNIMRFNDLAVAGAMAEWLVLHDYPEDSFQRALAARAGGAQLPARTELERFSLCSVRAAPGQTIILLRSDVATPAEQDALKAMSDAFVACIGANQTLKMTRPTVRGGLALAAFRLMTPPQTTGTQ